MLGVTLRHGVGETDENRSKQYKDRGTILLGDLATLDRIVHQFEEEAETLCGRARRQLDLLISNHVDASGPHKSRQRWVFAVEIMGRFEDRLETVKESG